MPIGTAAGSVGEGAWACVGACSLVLQNIQLRVSDGASRFHMPGQMQGTLLLLTSTGVIAH
jgi:hypothetical protein